ncbi:TPA: hypothetical protein L9220_003249 [Klebsiella aerogenes]|uniref:hypothetical protein n=1 Tax=Klebsiella aerogenes TaxID=548 RepID=UPI00063CEB0F|nr:hypothetical protein [Klebsiella aerogenes]EMB4649802.1 hypothetical protein [Klebsiella aerogenes]KLE98336.1 hypothetical protein YA23_04185 [Klebsiella aerogenes]MDQ9493052.1 hypothetical protein [Klebsiella aerogenes]HBR6954372.1 hypothetical protein [Klebsiella aerogenes]
MSKTLTDEELNVLIEKAQAHSEVMFELGSEQEAEESGQILSALSELKRLRRGVVPQEVGDD